MATSSSVLHVGLDHCYRIPIMERAGLRVFQSECSTSSIRNAIDRDEDYLAITFEGDSEVVLPSGVIAITRKLSSAALVLFEGFATEIDTSAFDLVIPPQTAPTVWLKSLAEAIQESQKLHEQARRLRQGCAEERSRSRSLRAASQLARINPIEQDFIWRGRIGDTGDD